MSHHLEELKAHLRSEGMSPEEASAEAVRRFGDPDRFAREASSPAEGSWRRRVDAIRQDLTHAIRQMLRHPLASGVTVATLAVGVAATTIVYSVVHAVVLAPLPFEEPDRLVHVSQTSPQGRLYSTSEPNFVDFRARSASFAEMAAIGWESPVLTGLGDPVSIEARRVSHTFFPLLGIAPIVGRSFQAEENRYGSANDVALLSEGTWRRRFGTDPDVVGRTITLDARPREIVGVVPSDRGWPGVEVFLPLAPNPDVYRDDQRLETLARLGPGVSLDAARHDMAAVTAELSEEYPESNDGWGAAVRPIREWLVGSRLTRLGRLLLASVSLFLLMACASVSNLLLARASARIREMGLRSALGAGRRRIASQLLSEGGVLAGVGALLALILADQGLRLVKAFGPGDVARLSEASLDPGVLLVAFAATLLTVAVAGLAPALLLARPDRHAVLRGGARGGSAEGRSVRDALVVAQFALAVTVVSGAGLLGRSFVELQRVELGIDTESVVHFAVRLPDTRFSMQVLALFGVVALMLAALGIYGVTAFSVARRRREIGVRIALGAEPSGVHWMVVGRALRLALLGIAGGAGAALLLSSFMGALLYDVAGTDPVTLATVVVLTALVAVASTWIPARRAVGLDPREALVEE